MHSVANELHFHTIKSILNQQQLLLLLFYEHNFHTIKSILNLIFSNQKFQSEIHFHTIKSILNQQ